MISWSRTITGTKFGESADVTFPPRGLPTIQKWDRKCDCQGAKVPGRKVSRTAPPAVRTERLLQSGMRLDSLNASEVNSCLAIPLKVAPANTAESPKEKLQNCSDPVIAKVTSPPEKSNVVGRCPI